MDAKAYLLAKYGAPSPASSAATTTKKKRKAPPTSSANVGAVVLKDDDEDARVSWAASMPAATPMSATPRPRTWTEEDEDAKLIEKIANREGGGGPGDEDEDEVPVVVDEKGRPVEQLFKPTFTTVPVAPLATMATVSADLSPPRRPRRHDSDDDQSPPRRPQRHDSDDDDQSPPRRPQRHDADDGDQSPPRRPQRHDADDGDQSPPRRPQRHDSDDEQAARIEAAPPPPKRGVGLQRPEDIQADLERRKQESEARFKAAAPEQLGRSAETVYRDKEGRRIDLQIEKAKKMAERRAKMEEEEKQMEWGKGLVQKRQREEKANDFAKEAAKPFARYADDVDMNRDLMDRDRWGDPMAVYFAKKRKEQAGVQRPKYRGPPPAPNRFSIAPGYRWDGVDRSNGFEHKVMTHGLDRAALEIEAYKYAVSDM